MVGNGVQFNTYDSAKVGFLNSASFRAASSNPFYSVQSLPDSFQTNSTPIKEKKSSKLSFGQIKQNFDKFVLAKRFNALANKQEIENMIAANPDIEKILSETGIKKEICLENLSSIYNEHIAGTVSIAKDIAQELNLPKEDMKMLEKGALFHDFGKVLMPREILEKPGRLTPQEQKIISKHALLGYELLKTTGLEEDALNIIKNHHKYKYNLDNSHSSMLSQIVTTADIYSALTTQRSYKKAMSPQTALKIMDKLCDENKLDKNIVNALKMSLQEEKAAA